MFSNLINLATYIVGKYTYSDMYIHTSLTLVAHAIPDLLASLQSLGICDNYYYLDLK